MTRPDLGIVAPSNPEAEAFSMRAATAMSELGRRHTSDPYARARYYRYEILAPLAKQADALGAFDKRRVVDNRAYSSGYEKPLIEITPVDPNALQYLIDPNALIHTHPSRSSVLHDSSLHGAGTYGGDSERVIYLNHTKLAISAMQEAVKRADLGKRRRAWEGHVEKQKRNGVFAERVDSIFNNPNSLARRALGLLDRSRLREDVAWRLEEMEKIHPGLYDEATYAERMNRYPIAMTLDAGDKSKVEVRITRAHDDVIGEDYHIRIHASGEDKDGTGRSKASVTVTEKGVLIKGNLGGEDHDLVGKLPDEILGEPDVTMLTITSEVNRLLTVAEAALALRKR